MESLALTNPKCVLQAELKQVERAARQKKRSSIKPKEIEPSLNEMHLTAWQKGVKDEQ